MCSAGYSKHRVEGSKLGLCVWKHVASDSVKQWQSASFCKLSASDMFTWQFCRACRSSGKANSILSHVLQQYSPAQHSSTVGHSIG